MDTAARRGRTRVHWRSLPLLFAGIVGWLIFFLLVILAFVWLTAPSNPLGLDGWAACSLLLGVAILLGGWLLFVSVATYSQVWDGSERRASSMGGVWWFLLALLEMCGVLLNGMLNLLLRPNGPPQWVAYLLMYGALLFLPTGATRQPPTADEGNANQARRRAAPLFLYLLVIFISLFALLVPDALWNRLHRTPRATTPQPRPARPARRVPRPLVLLPVFALLLAATVGTLGLLVIEAPEIFPTYTLNTGQDITHSMAWAPNGRHLAFAEEQRNQLVVWDATSHRTSLRLACPYIYTGVAWSPDSDFLVAACDSTVVTVWVARTGAVVRTIDGGQSSLDYAWSPFSDTLALLTDNNGSSYSTIQLWNIVQGTQVATFPLPNVGNQIAWSPDGQWLAVAEARGVRILSADAGADAQYLTDDGNGVINIAWSPDSTRLLVATYHPEDTAPSPFLDSAPDLRVSVWQVADARQTLVLLEQPALDLSLAWSPDGQSFALAGSSVQVVSAATGQQVATLHGTVDLANRLAWSSDSAYVAVSGSPQRLTLSTMGALDIWRVSNSQRVFSLPTSQFSPPVAWASNSQSFAVGVGGYGGVADVYNLRTGQVLFTWRGQSGGSEAIAWSPTGNAIATGTYEGPVMLWHPLD